MALVVQKEPFICFLYVNTGFKAALDFGDIHANEWQSIIAWYFHRKLNGGVGFIKTSANRWCRRDRVPELECCSRISCRNSEACSHMLVSLRLNT